ncbi:MAG: RdgB/HAM1 family non-canonical purine NTP pyrophosphatase [Bifidobacterium aquikefiri]|uniref:dITP/XTP pyrophosphatase n=1 Tax=Bifidobacterium aquikefiri TaxID=1653207 RepID=A0A261G3P4_9BIFI|nr:RdgB/HAM1 family non-canonical purine NTP pyrophosphatase [Bifidobacterium aquikefiri]OZG66039.1 non-canonical purine NTP pyrophosphatase [Bifidobacterium aquikefiri]
MRLIVATHNEGKLVEIQSILKSDLGSCSEKIALVTAGSLGLPDPVETGTSFEENALLKARDVAARTGCPALADDSGLIVDFLGAAPGILSARWSGVHGDDAANIQLLLAQLKDIPDDKRAARFMCAMALVIPDLGAGSGQYEHVEYGIMKGRINHSPIGAHGFGYDPIFVPNDQPEQMDAAEQDEKLTSAQMSSQQKNAISHRGQAIRNIVPFIDAQLLK